jgi:trk system potassium uptake protein TrkH
VWLWRFIVPLDRQAVARHLGAVLRLLAIVLVVPAVTALVAGDSSQALAFTATGVAAGTVGLLAGRERLPELGQREAIVVTALAYPLAALLGVPAFMTVGSPVDALFESMSGFTTTGLSVMDEAMLPVSLLFFRAYSQWLGGLGIIVLSLVLLAGTGSAAAKLYSSEFGERNMLGSVLGVGRIISIVYAGLTVLAVVALITAGAGRLDAVLHALALVSTGGFSPFADSIGAYDSAAIAAVSIVFMVFAALSFPLYYLTWRIGWRRLVGDTQLRLLLLLLFAGAAAAVAFEGWGGADALKALFHVTSAATTTGFVLEDPADWAEGTRLLAVGHMFVGGATGSTAGGLKLLRLAILLLLGGWAVTRAMLPREARVPLQIQHVPVSDVDVRHAIALLVSLAALVLLSAILLTAAGESWDAALFEATSAANTVGLSVGVTRPDLADWAKLVLVVNMWAGRVEVLPVLVLAHPANWRRRRVVR